MPNTDIRNLRDKRGWRIPKSGTKSRSIYNLAILGFGPAKMAQKLNMDSNTVGVLLWRIRNPGKSNAVAKLDRVKENNTT